MTTTVPAAVLVAVNVVHEVIRGPTRWTAIDKRPVGGAVQVGELGLVGDRQCDTRYHGGVDKALYAYAVEDAEWWGAELGREIPPGLFGENLTTSGLDITGAVIGEQWRIGGATNGILVEVRSARTPCGNLSGRMGIHRFHHRFAKTGRVGAYLKVLETGSVRAGNRIVVVHRPTDGPTVGETARRL
jgi:MOSC domain-containing protein YiiM